MTDPFTGDLMPNRPVACLVVCLIFLVAVPSAHADELSGQWSGNWKSFSSGHQGPLKAQICKVSEDCYRADFSGRFWKIMPFDYSVTLRVIGRDENATYLAGSTYLGRLMGTFSYTATVQNGCLTARYRAKRDCGSWTLRKRCN